MKENLKFISTDIHWLKVNNKNNRTMCEIRTKLSMKIPKCNWRHPGVIMVNLEQIL